MNTRKLTIALDGPAGSGKSTVTRKVAARINYLYLNSGSMYRAVTLLASQKGISLHNRTQLVDLVQKQCQIDFTDNGKRTLLNGIDVSEEIRTPDIEQQVVIIAKIPEIRQEMVKQQRRIAKNSGVIAEGRDVTTVVFPNADLKFYITASVEERARRRFNEFQTKSVDCSFEQIKNEIRERDKQDQSRQHSPLRKAEDATIIDTTQIEINQVVDLILEKIKEHR
ncbi:MAG: (d)CMP kinase [Candidatus Poribacteria bacterium]|nr:(d)CMP kinase [Candidatus Poribacteria bacterium]